MVVDIGYAFSIHSVEVMQWCNHQFIRRSHNLLVGESSAEKIKKALA